MKISAQIGDRVLEVGVDRHDGGYVVEIDGERMLVDAHKLEGDFYSLLTGGRSYEVSVEPRGDGYLVRHGAAATIVRLADAGRRAREAMRGSSGAEQVVAQMPGKVVRVLVAEGDTVQPGQGLLVLEAMKMENEIASERGGTVERLAVDPGATVEGGALLAVVVSG